MNHLKITRKIVDSFICSLMLLILATIAFSFAVVSGVDALGVPQPFRIGGLVTIDGTQITQANDDGLVFTITKSDGSNYTDINTNHPQDSDGLNTSNFYLIDIPIYSALQPGGGVNQSCW